MKIFKRIIILLLWLFYWPLLFGGVLIVSPFIVLAWIIVGDKPLDVIDYIYEGLEAIEDWSWKT